ncbi:MAG: 4Fe-4S binding protein [Deltaproteobacteria bacterium]|nr:4Fe-4S binding protein [Deltaproteobacteria bacterium]
MKSKVKRNPVSLREELPFLKARVKTLETRLDRFKLHISKVEQRKRGTSCIAVVETKKCLGCGICEKACPAGAITVNNVARVNPVLCVGCRRCAHECPQGAISLRPFILKSFSYRSAHPLKIA